MLTLALETSYRATGVALGEGGRLLSRQVWPRQKSSSEVVTELIEKCFAEAALHLKQVELLAVSVGPGSFTGIRVGVNVARSLGFALGCPIVAVSTPWLLAQNAPQSPHRLAVLLEAFRNLYYFCPFTWKTESWEPISTIQAVRGEQLAHLLGQDDFYLGPGFATLPSGLRQGLGGQWAQELNIPDEPQAEVLARFVSRTPKSFSFIHWRDLKPLYIRDSEAEEKLRSGLLKPVRTFDQ